MKSLFFITAICAAFYLYVNQSTTASEWMDNNISSLLSGASSMRRQAEQTARADQLEALQNQLLALQKRYTELEQKMQQLILSVIKPGSAGHTASLVKKAASASPDAAVADPVGAVVSPESVNSQRL